MLLSVFALFGLLCPPRAADLYLSILFICLPVWTAVSPYSGKNNAQ